MINLKRTAEKAAVEDLRAYAAECAGIAQEFKEKIPLKIERDANRTAVKEDGSVEIDMEDLKRTMEKKTRPEAYDAPVDATGKPVYETQLKPAKATSNTVTITNDTVDEDVKAKLEAELDIDDEGR